MEITQAIVAYRNPFEMWLWESGAIILVIPLITVFCIVSFIVSLKYRNKR